MRSDGTGLRQITPSSLGALSAQWSPNGTSIAFTSGGADPQVWVVRPNGDGLRRVTFPTDGSDSWTPVWSPSGRKLLFQQSSPSGGTSLWTVNVDGSRPAKVLDLPGFTSYDWGTAPVGCDAPRP